MVSCPNTLRGISAFMEAEGYNSLFIDSCSSCFQRTDHMRYLSTRGGMAPATFSEILLGGLAPDGPQPPASPREVTLLQRKAGKLGNGLGKTTGWIHRTALKMKRVRMIGGVNYERIDAEGLVISYGEKRENPATIACDTIVLCAGQVPQRDLADALTRAGKTVHVIGGAFEAGELDAKRAIDQAARLAARL